MAPEIQISVHLCKAYGWAGEQDFQRHFLCRIFQLIHQISNHTNRTTQNLLILSEMLPTVIINMLRSTNSISLPPHRNPRSGTARCIYDNVIYEEFCIVLMVNIYIHTVVLEIK